MSNHIIMKRCCLCRGGLYNGEYDPRPLNYHGVCCKICYEERVLLYKKRKGVNK